jgi:hypothetical protein
MRKFNRLFGIGISRTGTTSLTVGLKMLGITTIHFPKTLADFWQYRAATDTTVACRFKELDLIFPHSLFIYTERDRESWIKSVSAHNFKTQQALEMPPEAVQFVLEARVRIYGAVQPKQKHFSSAYDRHHDEVTSYFNRSASRCLRMNIAGGEGWDKLCRFLDVPLPDTPFPHLHKGRQ